MSFVHEKVQSGLTINAALKLTKKDRKTVDRFRNIYYLHVLDSDRLKQVSTCVLYYYIQQWQAETGEYLCIVLLYSTVTG